MPETQQLNRAERLMEIGRLLFGAPQGLKASELAKRLGCHRSTIYRDIDSLSKIQIPIWQDKDRFGIHKDQYVTSVQVTLHEAMALYLSARLLSTHSDKHNAHAISALEKLAHAMPTPIGEHIAKTAAATGQRKVHRNYLRILETLTRAWAERRQVRLTYHNPQTGETTRRILDPYFVEPSPIGYACYIIGYDHLRHAIREFKIERIQSVALLDTEYEIKDNFDPYQYLDHAWGIMGGDKLTQVKLRFSPHVAYRVKESDWPGVTATDDTPDGGCILTLNVNHTLEMKPWIRGWGPDCEVLQPDDLRREIAEAMIAAGKMYKDRRARN